MSTAWLRVRCGPARRSARGASCPVRSADAGWLAALRGVRMMWSGRNPACGAGFRAGAEAGLGGTQAREGRVPFRAAFWVSGGNEFTYTSGIIMVILLVYVVWHGRMQDEA